MGTAIPYDQFLKNKHVRNQAVGIDVSEDKLCPMLFDWQKSVVKWALKAGRAALFEDCGCGKALQSLAWSEQVVKYTNKPVLMLCPLAVSWQAKSEADKFGISVPTKVVASETELVMDGINITNYEKLDKFTPSLFGGVVLDESSILKSFVGKTKQALCRAFNDTRFKLCCTATPAPNDLMELGNHSDFLGIMPSNEILSIWFINTGKAVGKYFLRPHGAADFWRWCASWAVCIDRPSVIGFSDEGYTLPKLNVIEHIVESSDKPANGFLFDVGKAISATNVHQEKRRSLEFRADKVAEIIDAVDDYWAIWCDTNYEADALMSRIKRDAIEVRGSMSTSEKESLLKSFSSGEAKIIVTKPEIGGLGLNWQHCCNTTWFAGFSYEKFYQSIRRFYRFGQKREVNCHVVMSELESQIAEAIRRKQREHETMKCEMARAMQDGMMEELGRKRILKAYRPTEQSCIPAWLKSKQPKLTA